MAYTKAVTFAPIDFAAAGGLDSEEAVPKFGEIEMKMVVK